MAEGEERGQGGLQMLWLKERREGREGCQCSGSYKKCYGATFLRLLPPTRAIYSPGGHRWEGDLYIKGTQQEFHSYPLLSLSLSLIFSNVV
jgi:hypothetical protein